ncbi:hypothetical protein H1R20_g9454, partial [Candolleomyces eurysporus]
MGNLQYFDATNVIVHPPVESQVNAGWERLLENISPNALHNSSARYDAPRCDEDTRVEVTRELTDWIKDRDSPQRLLCMTGAAGSGKSALQQTIAERSFGSDTLAAAFFFSSTDSTRNTASPVVATIAYQLGLKHPLFQSSIVAAVKRDPLIFSQSLQSQMEDLIVGPFKSLRSKQIGIGTFPYAILIDGLDECKGEPDDIADVTADPTHVDADDRHRAEDRQEELLHAIKHCLLDNDLPFRVFLSSRPELVIRTALAPGGYLREVAYHLELSSSKYDASGDMRRYLERRFKDIGLRTGNPQWFTQADIETLVRAASGQFIYVATVYKYISQRRASPSERLKIVLTWAPHEGLMARPFEALDRLYTNILLAAKNAYEAVDTHRGRDFLLLFRVYHSNDYLTRMSADTLSVLLGLELGAEESLVSDLHSLVVLEKESSGRLHLRQYHKSYSDFLETETRAKDLFVSRSRVCAHLAKCCMQYIIECPLDFVSELPDKCPWGQLPLPERTLIEAVNKLPYFLEIGRDFDMDEEAIVGFTHKDGWPKLNKLLPRACRMWVPGDWEIWIASLCLVVLRLASRKPEVAAFINGFVEKWVRDAEEWGRMKSKELEDEKRLLRFLWTRG